MLWQPAESLPDRMQKRPRCHDAVEQDPGHSNQHVKRQRLDPKREGTQQPQTSTHCERKQSRAAHMLRLGRECCGPGMSTSPRVFGDHTAPSPESLITDISTSPRSDFSDPVSTTYTMPACLSPSVKYVMDGLRLTLSEKDMMRSLLHLSETDSAQPEFNIAGSAEAIGGEGSGKEQQTQHCPAFWLNGFGRKYLTLTNAGTTPYRDADYISRLFPDRIEESQNGEVELSRDYPCLIIPATPPSDNEEGAAEFPAADAQIPCS